MDRRNQKDLIAEANSASRSLRLTALVIEAVALISIVLLIVFLVDEAYGWPLFTGLVLSVFVTVLLAGRVARARAVGLEIAAEQLEMAREARGKTDRPEVGDRVPG